MSENIVFGDKKVYYIGEFSNINRSFLIKSSPSALYGR